jgi:hypothetical protein
VHALIPLVLTFGPEAAVSGPRQFTHPLASRFGYPNDEAQVYHWVLTG